MSYQYQAVIKKKPFAGVSSQEDDYLGILDDYFDEQDDEDDNDVLIEKVEELGLERRPVLPLRPNTLPLIPRVSEPTTVTHTDTTIAEVPSASKSIWKTAVDETVYFAGGLVSRPAESTKHFSILRHSSAVVFYQGPSTSVTVTIFSVAPLPPDRSLWLQRKGYSGNMGMNVSTILGTSSNWIDVTPTYEARPTDMSESDERAWARDMKKFLRRKPDHAVRETCIIRIPASASDGYFRLVLCTGESRKKVLCPSPVFRVASTSSDVSIFRGASLSTMPLEVGLKAASVVGTTMANKYIGPARALMDNRVAKYTNKYKPGFVTERADHIAYAKSGCQNELQSLEQNFDGTRDVSYDPLHGAYVSSAPFEVVGPDSGPGKPFPVKLSGTIVEGTGRNQARSGVPSANLSGVSSDLLLRLGGVYIGWARVEPTKGVEDISQEWHEAIITIGPSHSVTPGIVSKNVATVHIVYDFRRPKFYGAKMKTLLMAYLRPAPAIDRSIQPTDMAELAARDVNIALASLSRESWTPQRIVEQMKNEKSARSTVERYVEVRTRVQKGVDSIPLHLAGVRTAGADLLDKAYGRGGLYIQRTQTPTLE